MSEPSAAALTGQVVLGEHRLERLARDDGALSVFQALSTVDGGTYTVMIAADVVVDTASTALEEAVVRAARHSVGLKGVVPLLSARTVSALGASRLGVVRRGEPGEGLGATITEGPRSLAEALRVLSPVVAAVSRLHEQGMVHGAITPTTVISRQGELLLDAFGLSSAAEAAGGSRGARDLLPKAYRPPEVDGLLPSLPGPWSDVYAVALLAVELLAGRLEVRAGLGSEIPTPSALGLRVSARAHDLFSRLLSPSPSQRPPSLQAAFDDLLEAARSPEPAAPAAPAAAPSLASPSLASPSLASPSLASPSLASPSAPGPSTASPFGAPRAPDAAPDAPPGAAPPPPARPPHGLGGPSRAEKIAALQRGVVPLGNSDEQASSRLLGWLVGGGIALLALGMAGTIAFVVMRAKGGATGASSGAPAVASTAPTAWPSSPAPPSPTAAATPSLPAAPPRVGGVPTYPADHDALVPVEADAAVRGDREALVTLVIFGDLSCPFTAQAIGLIPSLEGRYGSDLRVVFKHYPLPGRPDARSASEASAAVLDKAKGEGFWRFVAAVTQGGQGLDAGRLEELGIKAGLPAGAVTDAIARHSYRKVVDRDVELGRRLGVRGTPVMFFNGRRLDGLQPVDKLTKLLDAELRRARADLGKGTPREKLYASRVTANITTSEGEKEPDDTMPRRRP